MPKSFQAGLFIARECQLLALCDVTAMCQPSHTSVVSSEFHLANSQMGYKRCIGEYQGATLRAGFPKDAKNHRVYAFLDESKLQALIKRGKAWTTKAKNCIQTMQAGRPMSAAVLHNLLEEAKTIKLNLFPEVRHPSSVIPERFKRLKLAALV